jgi:hypothetical protein
VATKILTNLDLQQNQLIKARLDNQSSDPTGSAGQVYYNTSTQVIKYFDGTTWQTLSAATSSVASVTATSPIQVNGGTGPSTGAVTISILPASGSNAGSFSAANYSTLNAATSANTVSTLVQRDSNGDFSARDISIRMASLSGTPTNATDAATKGYVDSVATGLDVKASVRAASTANVTVTYSATGGASGRGQITAAPNTLDGVTLVNSNRILLKDQTTGAQNGIWVVTTAGTGSNGTWDRATDFDTDAEVTSGAFTFVEEGTVNDNSGWVLTTNNPITIGGSSGTALSFSQFSGAGQITAGNGLTKTGNTIDVVGTSGRISVGTDSVDIDAGYVGQTSITTLGTVTTGTWSATTISVGKGGTGLTTVATNGILYGQGTSNMAVAAAGTQYQVFRAGASGVPAFGSIDLNQAAAVGTSILGLANGGTNASSASGARTQLASDVSGGVLPVKVAFNIGDGSSTAITITHNLGTRDITWSLISSATPWEAVIADITFPSTSTTTVTFNTAPALNAYRLILVG